MKRVFVFCIGGTGLRVMKSMTMLLAAGMEAFDFTIVPVLIDPHENLEEKRNLQTLFEEYQSIYNGLTVSDGKRLNVPKGFFSAEITDLKELKGEHNDLSEPIAPKTSFGQYLNIGKLKAGDENTFFVQSLFSQANLDNNLDVGFKGNPNVGTVVLSEQIKGANWFQTFCNAFQKGDRVFIISSIFGGTGASGFPLLEKKIRGCQDFPNVKEAVMGAVSVLPYFSLEDPSTTDSDIDSANFLTKTKAALAYYEKNIESDYLYYIGEQGMRVTYANDEQKQEDKAHFIELIAATALFDFLSKPDDKPNNKEALSRGIKEDVESLSLSSLGDAYKDIVKCVADMALLNRLVSFLPSEIHFPLTKNRGFNGSFYEDRSFVNLRKFLHRFTVWYDELATNKRGFAPLNIADINIRNAQLSNWIQDFSLDAKDGSYYLLEMIKISNKDKDTSHDIKFRRFLNYAYQAINNYTKKIL